MKYIKEFGLPRSGTNYLKALLERNFNTYVLTSVGGGKHSKINREYPTNYKRIYTHFSRETMEEITKHLNAGTVPFIGIAKNPFAWMSSFVRFQKLIHRTKRIKLNGKLYVDLTKEAVRDMADIWIEYNSHWQSECGFMVKYEELLTRPEQILESIDQQLKLDRIDSVLHLPICMRAGGEMPGSTLNHPQLKPFKRLAHYQNKAYMKQFDRQQTAKIEAAIPDDLKWLL